EFRQLLDELVEAAPARGAYRLVQQVDRGPPGLAVEQPVQQLQPTLDRRGPVGEQLAELVLGAEQPAEPEQLVFGLVEHVVPLGQRLERLATGRLHHASPLPAGADMLSSSSRKRSTLALRLASSSRCARTIRPASS